MSKIEEWASSSSIWERCKAARSRRCPEELLETLRNDTDRGVRVNALINKKTSLEILRPVVAYWAANEQQNCLLRIMCRDDLTLDILRIIETFHPEEVLQYPLYPEEDKLRAAREGRIGERRKLARSKVLSQEIQDILVYDPSPSVRRALAGNKRISAATARTLMNDSSVTVLRNVISHPAVAEYKQDITNKIRQQWRGGRASAIAIAQHSSDPQQVAEAFDSSQEDTYVVSIALKNPLLDEERVEKACYHANPYLRNLAAEHPNCTEDGQIVVALLK